MRLKKGRDELGQLNEEKKCGSIGINEVQEKNCKKTELTKLGFILQILKMGDKAKQVS